ncbi:MAG: hypothetical protein Greene101420_873 [Parcubacteria group bacterium Greene1014_20]|nr:MAG: hypothetical protein Greene101420_873 [Parcubacteria group bacterium Greene1014_20]
MDEIPILDENNQKIISVAEGPLKSSSRVLPSSSSDELKKLVEGDVSEGTILNDLVSAKIKANTVRTGSSGSDEPQYNYAKMTEEILALSGVVLKNVVLRSRLENLIKSYIRSVRTAHDVKEFIVKKVTSGGLELGEENASRIMEVLKSFSKERYLTTSSKATPESIFTTPVRIVASIPEPAKGAGVSVPKIHSFFSSVKNHLSVPKTDERIQIQKAMQEDAESAAPTVSTVSSKGPMAESVLGTPSSGSISGEELRRREELGVQMGGTSSSIDITLGQKIKEEVKKDIATEKKGLFIPPKDNSVMDQKVTADTRPSTSAIFDLEPVFPKMLGAVKARVERGSGGEIMLAKDSLVAMTQDGMPSAKKSRVSPLSNSPAPVKKSLFLE